MPSSNMQQPDGSDAGSGKTPSYATTCVMDGVPVRHSKEILIEPTWGELDCTDGVWQHPTRGDGETDVHEEQDANTVPDNGHDGHFGVLVGNWGGKYKTPAEDDYMNGDIANTACQLILLQEIEPLFWEKVKKQSETRDLREGGGRAPGTSVKPKPFIGVRGEGPMENSLLITGKPGIVLGCRLRVFHKHPDGSYREKGKDMWALSRIMVADFKMKNFRIRGSGDSLSDILPVANVHMNAMTAKKGTQNPKETTKRFWDLLARYLLQYGVRLMAGDFNMSFLCVVAEMRARGFQINLAAWYPFYMTHQEEMFVDSCGVFFIGPWQGVRLIYDCSLFDIDPPERTSNNSMVMKIIKDADGKEITRKPYEVHDYQIVNKEKVQGYPLDSYLPKNKAKADFVRWTFDCVQDGESAVAEQKEATRKNPSLYPEAQFSFAVDSWGWPKMPLCNQKLVDIDRFDVDTYFARGAHMPLMLFVGEKGRTRRSAEARAVRQEKAANRGFTRERINNIKAGREWSGYQTRENEPWTDGTWDRSSSSNGAWQDERGWNTGWRSKNNWYWKQ